MVLFPASLKSQGMTLKILLNSFMPHYTPTYMISAKSSSSPWGCSRTTHVLPKSLFHAEKGWVEWPSLF